MLLPGAFDGMADDILELYGQLEDSILRDIVRRMVKTGGVTDMAAWQAQRLQDAGMLYDDIVHRVARMGNVSDSLVQALFVNASIEAMSYDIAIYTAAGLSPLPLRQSPAADQVLQALVQKTGGHLRNLTLTMAATSRDTFVQAVTLAEMQVESGAFDYVTAIRNAVRSTAQTGAEVLYPSGRKAQLDVAVRRAVLTGASQTAAQISLRYADDMGCDLVETTAHPGARPEHQVWQGKVFSRSGQHTKFPPFEASTGYGTGSGLCGWNCRHSFFPFFEGLSTRAYPREKLREYEDRTVSYNGETLQYYDATQHQRAMERDIRKSKRELAGYDEGMKSDDPAISAAARDDFDTAAIRLKRQEARLKDYQEQTGLLPQRERQQVYGFGRSPAQKAVWVQRRELAKYSAVRYNKDGTMAVTDDWTGRPSFHLNPSFKPNAVVDTLSRGGKQHDRTIYGANAVQQKQIHGGNHGTPKAHPYGEHGEHAHDIKWVDGKSTRTTRELTDEERQQHRDLLKGDE